MVKAQVLTIDFVTSIAVFISILVLIGVLWNAVSTDLTNKKNFDDSAFHAVTISELLVKTSGIPENWTGQTVEVVGLAESENVLSPSKSDYFVNMILTNYTKAKELLGLSQDFYFELFDVDNQVTLMRAPPVSLDAYANVASVTRFAVFNGSVVKLFFAVIS